MTKSVGILTLPLHANYGGILQAYALQIVLMRMGYSVFLIDEKRTNVFSPTSFILYLKRVIKKYILRRKNVIVFLEHKQAKEHRIISREINHFIHSHFSSIVSVKQLKKMGLHELDAIIVGSDQIWRPKYFPKIEDAYLDFAKNWQIKRIAYAASFGSDEKEYTKVQIKKCHPLIRQFDAVSVRENSGVLLCKDYFDVNASLVLDPTMLLPLSDYRALIKSCNNEKKSGIFAYILDETEEKNNIVDTVGAYKNSPVFTIHTRINDQTVPLEERIAPPIEQWLNAFEGAQLVITDSFHACVFSILFNKPFIVIGNKERGMARFNSLLSLFNMENRLITSKDQGLELAQRPVHWDEVNAILSEKRKESITYLRYALEK